ncbi:hypothetical protein [Polaribacter cellanae]|uniref:Lipoprotein n=1 Tax=Polaribacter cellanae TaxID=2818493 RepID=A0A975CRE8_9FLAO|nr:hypothetical protein [Polaribacter cellanae]QTE21848.1 hypothetical protein J3359_13625 [Polaribacter cellanae]QTE24228.1 hypothetical protein J3359_08185 [Polaribacter cellanae]
MKKTNIVLKLFIITLIFTSCNSQVNHIEIDKIAHIDIFENYEDNVKLSKDIVNQNWNEFLKTKISGFDSKDTKELKFFTNTRPEENKLIIQFRYPKFDKPKNLEKIREVTIEQIEEIKKQQKKNETLILESTKKVEELIEMLNNENYSEFYKNLHSNITKEFTYEQFLSFLEQIKELGFENKQREYLNKALVKFNDSPNELTDIIEYRYWQKNNRAKYESFNFQNFNGKMELVGYRVY